MSRRETFERNGVVRVAGAVADVDAMRACALERVAAIEMVEVAGAMRPARGHEMALWAIGREAAFAPLPGALARAVDEIFGAGAWVQPDGELGGLAMPSFPCPGARRGARGDAWHVDEPSPPGSPPGRVMIAYALLDRVEPGGGATVAVAGSHRWLAALADRRGTAIGHLEACDALAGAEPWFAALVEHGELGAGCVSDGIALDAVELTGEPGDLVLLDPRCLHTISANVSTRPRLVMRLTCVRA